MMQVTSGTRHERSLIHGDRLSSRSTHFRRTECVLCVPPRVARASAVSHSDGLPSAGSCPPRTFLPALCRIFLDECAPDNVLEVTARAVTYYLDVSAECTRRIVSVDGAVKAMCNRLVVAELTSRSSKDLAEQCIKVGSSALVVVVGGGVLKASPLVGSG